MFKHLWWIKRWSKSVSIKREHTFTKMFILVYTAVIEKYTRREFTSVGKDFEKDKFCSRYVFVRKEYLRWITYFESIMMENIRGRYCYLFLIM